MSDLKENGFDITNKQDVIRFVSSNTNFRNELLPILQSGWVKDKDVAMAIAQRGLGGFLLDYYNEYDKSVWIEIVKGSPSTLIHANEDIQMNPEIIQEALNSLADVVAQQPQFKEHYRNYEKALEERLNGVNNIASTTASELTKYSINALKLPKFSKLLSDKKIAIEYLKLCQGNEKIRANAELSIIREKFKDDSDVFLEYVKIAPLAFLFDADKEVQKDYEVQDATIKRLKEIYDTGKENGADVQTDVYYAQKIKDRIKEISGREIDISGFFSENLSEKEATKLDQEMDRGIREDNYRLMQENARLREEKAKLQAKNKQLEDEKYMLEEENQKVLGKLGQAINSVREENEKGRGAYTPKHMGKDWEMRSLEEMESQANGKKKTDEFDR